MFMLFEFCDSQLLLLLLLFMLLEFLVLRHSQPLLLLLLLLEFHALRHYQSLPLFLLGFFALCHCHLLGCCFSHIFVVVSDFAFVVIVIVIACFVLFVVLIIKALQTIRKHCC